MNNKELLRVKIREFKEDHKMTHKEYGLPYAGVVDGSVVFCKNKKTFDAYKKEVTASRKKIIVAISIMCISLSYGLIGGHIGLSNNAIVFGLWGLFIIGLIVNVIIETNAKKHAVKFKDVLIYNGPTWDN